MVSRTSHIATLTQGIEELATNLEVAQAVNQHQSQSIGATISSKRKRQSNEWIIGRGFMHQSLLDHLNLPTRSTRVMATVNSRYWTEVNSHANTCAFGSHSYVVQDTGDHVSVDGFVFTIGSVKKVPICTMAVAYDCSGTFDTYMYILFFPQSLYIKGMTTNLLSPFHLRSFGITVNDVPLQHMEPEERSTTQHSIQVGDLHIPLELQGIMLGFATRNPTSLKDYLFLCSKVTMMPVPYYRL
jgi:hypothetical protein